MSYQSYVQFSRRIGNPTVMDEETYYATVEKLQHSPEDLRRSEAAKTERAFLTEQSGPPPTNLPVSRGPSSPSIVISSYSTWGMDHILNLETGEKIPLDVPSSAS